ncbi:Type 1 glutamine amidotransferase-like domain-containing protein [Exiguobacterium acetylicum]|uniref:Type 1 glutamine amidotransferase-like domain-containing protein n=1 Tax=Exiguobacterium acetylicum TaxID=41170 RepID=UPI001EE34FF1|nr:Type 1 glutamine amidotransferase-like domain-containing protein [Exiguobacterium acetylicum]UKS56395.1 Type 1 glutamine amidotransferase-like domain-containing protein [Exiguobacterium acetylicum]
MPTHLFLFGGGPPFTPHLRTRFAALTNGGPIAILYVPRTGKDWLGYASIYTEPLQEDGVSSFVHLPLSDAPTKEQLAQLKQCQGIIISGGETELYQRYLVDTELDDIIQSHFANGVPIAGFSAGALVSPEQCVIPKIDQRDGQRLRLPGLALLKDAVVCVHYETWGEAAHLVQSFTEENTSWAYGLADASGIYLQNQQLIETEGTNPVVLSQSRVR